MKNSILKTFFAFICLLIIPNANAAELAKGKPLKLNIQERGLFAITQRQLQCFQALQRYVNSPMQGKADPEAEYFEFLLPNSLGFDTSALVLSVGILLDLCNIDLARATNTNTVERINNCIEYFNGKKKDHLAQTLLTAYELGEYLGTDLIIQRAIINRMYDKIFPSTEEFDYEKFEKHLINPKDFDEKMHDKNTTHHYSINLLNKEIRSANLSYLLERLKSLERFGITNKVININLSHNKIRTIDIEDLKELKNSNLKIYLNIEGNPLLDETTKNIQRFQKFLNPPPQELQKDLEDKIRRLKQKTIASLIGFSLVTSLAITQLLKKFSPLITLIPSRKLQTGIKLGTYLLPLLGIGYFHYKWFKNITGDLELEKCLNLTTRAQTQKSNLQNFSITY